MEYIFNSVDIPDGMNMPANPWVRDKQLPSIHKLFSPRESFLGCKLYGATRGNVAVLTWRDNAAQDVDILNKFKKDYII